MLTLRNQVLAWAGFFIAAILLLWLFRSILLPFVVGGALAYLLNPLVNLLQRWGINRPWASMLVLALVLLLIVSLFLAIVPLVAAQGASLISLLPGYITDLQELLRKWAPQLNEWLGPERALQLESSLADLIGRGVEMTAGITAQLAQSSLTVLNTIAVLFITPVVGFYLLVDWEGMLKKIDDLLPRQYHSEIRGVLGDIDRAMAGVIRGQGGVILVLCIYYSTALTLSGLNFGLAIGLIGGLLSFIPYVGFLVGFSLSMTVALVQFWPDQWILILVVFGIYLVGQFLESNVLYPKLVGQSININPVWLMFALFAFALLFGFVGLLLAVPLTAISGVLMRFALAKYQASALYLGQDTPPPPPPARMRAATAKSADRKAAADK
ncbi:AI-2E family transporter [Devosia sp.]|uniref:AI-2E family transporter n=1 Tax=Devosia sp. TaxID=1871048 RepID=UPI003BA96DE8